MRIFVLGASGVAGRSALPHLVGAGHDVTCYARTDESEALLRGLGVSTARGDVEDPAQLRAWLEPAETVVDLRVRIPSATQVLLPGAWRDYRRLRGAAVAALVDAAIDVQPGRLVHDTVSMVYADGGDSWLDESARVHAPGPFAANIECERHLQRFTEAGGTGVALRFATFYGPDDQMSREIVSSAGHGRALVLGEPGAWHSAIHTSDVGRAIALAATAADMPAGVYNVADDEPLRRKELLAVLAEAAGRPSLRTPPRFLTRLGGSVVDINSRSQRVASDRFREVTGWRPDVPSRRPEWRRIVASGAG